MQEKLKTERVLPWRELRQVVPFTRQHVLRLEKSAKFPRRIRIGERRVGWLASEIAAWLETKIAERVFADAEE